MLSQLKKEIPIQDLRAHLSRWTIVSNVSYEIEAELESSLEQLRITWELLTAGTGRVLQVGAAPYFLTLLLREFGNYEMELINYFHCAGENVETVFKQRIKDRQTGEDLYLNYRSFDIERQPFPYEDESFDGVIMCDVLQRLIRDPVAVLAEVYRVLKPGGWMLLTTPNAAYYENIVKVWLAHNTAHPYSNQEPCDRDNRQYTLPEVQALFRTINGLVIDSLEARAIHRDRPRDWRSRVVRLVKPARFHEEELFCVAHKEGPFHSARPAWLYRTYAVPRLPESVFSLPDIRNQKPGSSLDKTFWTLQNAPKATLAWFRRQKTRLFSRCGVVKSVLRLPSSPIGPSRFSRRVCKICDEADWEGEEWLSLLDAMGIGHMREQIHRKAWEWAQGLYALQHLGLLREDATAIGVGVGIEQIMFYLTNHIQMVYATDIYGEGGFVNETAYADMLASPERYVRIPFRRDHLTVMYMDGCSLEFPDNHFDFAFSFSSIEHFGGHEAAAQSVKEMGRVVKPGGAVVITTEVILNGVPHNEFFLPEELDRYLVQASGLRLIEDIDYTISPLTLKHPVDFGHPSCRTAIPHVLCKSTNMYWTSVCLVMEKPAEG
jgi:SAM-dependent methyltransferase